MDTALLLKTVLTALGACCLIMMLVWLWAYRIRNAGVVDIFWAFNFTVIAAIIYFMADGYEPRKQLICGLAALWSIRLGIYLLIRVGSHLKEEEGRYKQLRQEWAPNPDRTFFIFFQAQALSNIFLAAPFFIIAMNKAPYLTPLELAGGAMTLISIIGEGLSDWQLKKFKSDPANKGKVCQYGLWNYSRHPNYFFQLMIWVSVFIMSLSSPWGWISIVCPLTIGYLIFKVTGIPMTEEQSIRTKGDGYREYQRTTSVFVPWFKKGK
jgi:steroid 5-alpha reductase family enzyme